MVLKMLHLLPDTALNVSIVNTRYKILPGQHTSLDCIFSKMKILHVIDVSEMHTNVCYLLSVILICASNSVYN